MVKNLEIERKFLIKYIPKNLGQYSKEHINQGYICAEKEREIRLRNKENNYY